MKYILALFLLPVLFAPAGAQQLPDTLWTLERCIRHASENNLGIRRQKLSEELAANELKQSKLNYFPSVSGSVGHNMSWGRSVNLQDLEIIQNKLSQSTSASLSASVALFEGFAKSNTVRSNKVQLEITRQETQKLKNDITIAITRAYLQLLLARETEATARENFNSVQEQVLRTIKLVDAGKQAYGSQLEIEAQAAAERVQLVAARNDVRTCRLTLLQLLDLPEELPFSVHAFIPEIEESGNFRNSDKTAGNRPVGEIYRQAMQLPQIRRAELELEKNRIAYKLQKGQSYPRLSLSAGYGSYYSDSREEAFFSQFNDNRNPSLGLTLSIPIFNNWRTNTAIRNARIGIRSSELNLKIEQQNLYKEISQAYNDALSCYEKYKAAEENLRSAQESCIYVQRKFELGMLSGTDYTVSRTNLFRSQSEYTRAKYQYIFQLKILDFYKGIPITL